MVDIYVIAENDVSEIRGSITRNESTMKTKKILLIGSCDFPVTPVMYLEPGKAPSLLIAKTTRVVTVM